jgi:hypothetical protein
MMSASVVWPPTSPAPNSRGPLMPVSRKLCEPCEPCSHRWDRHRRRASFRMPSDETLRVALVCTLPLLHFHPLGSRLSMLNCHNSVMTPPRWSSSSSAPAFRLAESFARRQCRVRVTPANLTVFAAFTVDVSTLPFWTSSGLWASLWSVRNPLSIRDSFRQSHGLFSSSVARVTNDVFSKEERSHHSRASRYSNHCQRSARHFLRALTFTASRLWRWATGPVYLESGKLDGFPLDRKLPCALFP